MIPFNRPPHTGNEIEYVLSSMKSRKISGDGEFGIKCQQWFEEKLLCKKALMTPSCTQALEMAAILAEIKQGDEVIMPSYTFVSTANAFVLRGAKIVFVDVRPDTLNIDETLIEQAITEKTKVIVPVHYAGVGCDMDAIMDIATRHDLLIVEDAAQAMTSTYKNRPLGTIGHMAAYSFHETKNFTSGGEGGLFIVNDSKFVQRAEIIREKGTNRSQFFRGMVDKYSWVDLGSSYLPSEIQSAYLWGQLECADQITQNRLSIWNRYFEGLQELANAHYIELPFIPTDCKHNGHMFYVKTNDLDERTELLEYLKAHDIFAVFHYVPLHSSVAGLRFGRFHGEDIYTTKESERLIRLPIWYQLPEEKIEKVIETIKAFYYR